jgi:hypothetical protein
MCALVSIYTFSKCKNKLASSFKLDASYARIDLQIIGEYWLDVVFTAFLSKQDILRRKHLKMLATFVI